MIIIESSETKPTVYRSAFRFDKSRSLWISSRGTDNRDQLLALFAPCIFFVFFWNYEFEFFPVIVTALLLVTIILGIYIAYRGQINQIEIDIPRSRIRLVQPNLFLHQKISYIYFSKVRFLRSTMVTADEYRFNALELILKSGDSSVEIARFSPTPVTDGSLSFRGIVVENSEANALRKQFCSLTGIRDFGFLSSLYA